MEHRNNTTNPNRHLWAVQRKRLYPLRRNAQLHHTGGNINAKIYVGEGIGNIIMTTPMLLAIHSLGYKIWLTIRPSSRAGKEVLKGWSLIEKGVPPRIFDKHIYTYWFNVSLAGREDTKQTVYSRIPDWKNQSEIDLNMQIAKKLGWIGEEPQTAVICPPEKFSEDVSDRVVVAPGCFPNEQSKLKRWEYWTVLLPVLGKTVLIGAPDDWYPDIDIGPEVRDLRGKLPLKETMQCIRDCKYFIGQDTGLAHIASALGKQTFVIFGPTSQLKNKPPGAKAITKGLPCQPCQFTEKTCESKKCLDTLTPEEVYEQIVQTP